VPPRRLSLEDDSVASRVAAESIVWGLASLAPSRINPPDPGTEPPDQFPFAASAQVRLAAWGEEETYFSTGTTMPRMMMFWQKMNTSKVGMAATIRAA